MIDFKELNSLIEDFHPPRRPGRHPNTPNNLYKKTRFRKTKALALVGAGATVGALAAKHSSHIGNWIHSAKHAISNVT